MSLLCKDCEYATKSFSDKILFLGYRFAKCAHPKSLTQLAKLDSHDADELLDGINRNKPNKGLYCSTARGYEDLCGRQASWFSAKQ